MACQLPVTRQEVACREFSANDSVTELARDLVANGFRVPGGQMEKQGRCITVHIRYIQ